MIVCLHFKMTAVKAQNFSGARPEIAAGRSAGLGYT